VAAASEGFSVSLTEALENYAAHHPETVDELLQWSSRKFDHFYLQFQKRQIIEGLAEMKDRMIAALWSNSNWDDDKGSRSQQIEEEIDADNPFFAAAERGLAKVEQKMGYAPSSEDKEIDMMKGLDQE
jgi:hypothetical protein